MIGGLLKHILSVLLPTRCVICQNVTSEAICPACSQLLEPIGNRCVRCGRQRQTVFASPDCGECHDERIVVTRARSLYVYNGAGRRALGEFKFNGKLGVGDFLAGGVTEWLGQGLSSLYGEPDMVVSGVIPVPLHPRRLRKRRYNQAELVARKIAAKLDVGCLSESLARTRETPTQVGLSAHKRRENVRGAFAVPERRKAAISGKSLLLVDDLMTTGATLASCATALKKGGAGQVYGLTVFSTVRQYEAEMPDDQPA